MFRCIYQHLIPQTKIAKAQEKHFLGEIDSGVYEKFMPRIRQEKSEILMEIQKLGKKVQTSRINTLFLITKRISDIYKAMKKGHFESFDETSLCVGMTGSQSNFLMEDLKRLEEYF